MIALSGVNNLYKRLEDTKGVIRSLNRKRTDKTMAERSSNTNPTKVEDTKGVIRSLRSKKNTIQWPKDRVTRTSLKTWGELRSCYSR